MTDAIDSQTVFILADLTVTVRRYRDEDAQPDDYGPGSTYDDTDVRASFKSGEWEFNILTAEVSWHDVVIAGESLAAVEHGTLRWRDENGDAQVTDCNAFAITSPDSPAASVISSALEYARQWAKSVTESGPLVTALNAAEQWAGPNEGNRDK